VDRKVHSFSISKPSLLVLVLVIEFFILKAVDHEQEHEHEHDYDARGEVTLSTLAYISR
jgi:hypothetical protein